MSISRESAAVSEAPRRSRAAAVALAAVLTLGLLPVPPAAMERPPPLSSPEEGGERVPVLFVADGDTVRVRRDGRKEWIRLLRIDTPEREERGYHDSRRALQEMVDPGQVSLVYEERGVVERDVHGRILAYLFVGSRNVNVEMVRLGWSPFWKRYGRGRFAAEFRQAEKEAREAGRGLWRKRR